jgi:hypothetical protein
MEFDWDKMDRYDMPRPLVRQITALGWLPLTTYVLEQFKLNKTGADRDRENK